MRLSTFLFGLVLLGNGLFAEQSGLANQSRGTTCYKCSITVIHIHAEAKSTIMTNEHTSLEIYTSHTLFEIVAKGLRKGDWTETATYWPPVSLSLAALLSRSAGLLNRKPEGQALCRELILTVLELQQLTPNSLNLSVAPGYIIVWHPPASCRRHICTQFNPFTVKVIPWYLRPDAPVPWSTVGSKVNMLHK